ARGVQVCFVTLHVGVGTFAPVKTDTLAGHRMHEERYTLGEATANAINLAKREGRRVVAVGTTTVRVLESCALSRPSDTLSHPMGEGRGEGKGVQHPTSNSKGPLSRPSDTLSHPMG